jgi:hypothetical protein
MGIPLVIIIDHEEFAIFITVIEKLRCGNLAL